MKAVAGGDLGLGVSGEGEKYKDEGPVCEVESF